MNDNALIRDETGRVICFVYNGNVYDGRNRKLGFVDARGTFDERGLRVSTTSSPSLLAGLALGRRVAERGW